MAQQVAILGLGVMGSGMAKNLLKAGFALRIWNRTRAKAEPFAAQGAYIADSPADAARGSDAVISMLADDEASRDVWLRAGGALKAAGGEAVLIESSTVTPEWIAELGAAADARGIALLDAPVTGSRSQAEGGALNFIVGGDGSVLDRVRPVLKAMGQNVLHVGPLGSGARLKLINNFLCGVQAASLAEGLAWIERSGLNREQSLEFLKTGAPGSPLLGALSSRMVEAKYEVNFLLPLMEKDLRYALQDAAKNGVELRTGAAADARFEDAVRDGFTDKDMSAVIEPLRRQKR